MAKNNKYHYLYITNYDHVRALFGENKKKSKNDRYYFSSEEEKDEYKKRLDEIKMHSAFSAHCRERGIDPDDVDFYWDKTKSFSVKVHPNSTRELTQEQLIELIQEKITSHAPNYKTFEREKTKNNNLLVIDPADSHFGKLSSSYETGESYNINVAKQRFKEGITGIISKSKGFGINKVLFIIGNDVLHYDTPKRQTTSGTPQDTDVMFYDMFNAALESHVEIIESLITEYDVDIIFCPSNHDYQSGWMFAQTLSAWFRNAKNVNIDASISHRKYYQYGQNLISASHGDGAKMTDMPLLMANEAPKLWANTTYRYVYLHHIHHKQRNVFQSSKDYIGVTVEYLRSQSSSDSWHYRNGYVGAKKAVEGFVHSFEHGQIARLTHYFK